MYTSTLLVSALAALSYAAPPKATKGSFNVSNFSFGCTTTCDWSFDVTVQGTAEHFPSVKKPVHCKGSTAITSFDQAAKTCGKISNTEHLTTFIGKNNQLHLKVQVDEPKAGATYWYEGATAVNAETSGKPQSKTFSVPVTKASAVA